MDLQLGPLPSAPQNRVEAVAHLVERLRMPLLSTFDTAELLTRLQSKVQQCSRQELVTCLEKKWSVRLGVLLYRIQNGEHRLFT